MLDDDDGVRILDWDRGRIRSLLQRAHSGGRCLNNMEKGSGVQKGAWMPERFENDKDTNDIFPKSRKLLDAYRKAEKLSRAGASREERDQAWHVVGQIERVEFNNGKPYPQF